MWSCRKLTLIIISKGGDLQAVLMDITNLTSTFQKCKISWISRDGNRVAKFVAKFVNTGNIVTELNILPEYSRRNAMKCRL